MRHLRTRRLPQCQMRSWAVVKKAFSCSNARQKQASNYCHTTLFLFVHLILLLPVPVRRPTRPHTEWTGQRRQRASATAEVVAKPTSTTTKVMMEPASAVDKREKRKVIPLLLFFSFHVPSTNFSLSSSFTKPVCGGHGCSQAG